MAYDENVFLFITFGVYLHVHTCVCVHVRRIQETMKEGREKERKAESNRKSGTDWTIRQHEKEQVEKRMPKEGKTRNGERQTNNNREGVG